MFDETHTTDELLKVLVASVSYSGISPAVELGDQFYFSGDAIYENNVISVIHKCEEMGYQEQDIVIDTIISGQRDVDNDYDPAKANAFDVLRRSSEVFTYY